ncbi:unnamed protein product [Linum trigynum]|uniref:Uncharacterized protein n=1 Tax=Linum trigynum TaxID=586398 RepID=A0AAV2FY13_9ROSI
MVSERIKKKKTDWSLPPRRGQIKAEILKSIVQTVASAAIKAVEVVGMKPRGGGSSSSSSSAGSAFATPPPSPTTTVKLSAA